MAFRGFGSLLGGCLSKTFLPAKTVAAAGSARRTPHHASASNTASPT
ncbi:hypothetical protein [Streptomyces sp. NPDC001056]